MHDLRSARMASGLTQHQAAAQLHVSQPYLAMLESGKRRLTPELARRAMKAYALSPTVLATSELPRRPLQPTEMVNDLAALGYPGFTHLRPSPRQPKNPAVVLLAALSQDELEARVVEALPWLLLRYPDLDRGWLLREAKMRDLQNRLGFVVTLARRLAERANQDEKAKLLTEFQAQLERSRLAREDSLGNASASPAERRWLADNRSEDARHWNLLADWTVEDLRYAG